MPHDGRFCDDCGTKGACSGCETANRIAAAQDELSVEEDHQRRLVRLFAGAPDEEVEGVKQKQKARIETTRNKLTAVQSMFCF